MKKIAIDVDNVLCTTTQEIINFINKKIPNLNLKMEDITTYYIENALPDEFKWIVPFAFEQKEVWKNVQLIDGAAKYVEKLFSEGYELYFATATTPDNFRKKVKFLERSFPFLPEGYVRKNCISIKNKQLLNVDFLIDDCPANLTGKRSYTSICYAYPWNDMEWKFGFDFGNKPFVRCNNWDEIYAAIKDFEIENRKKVRVNVKRSR